MLRLRPWSDSQEPTHGQSDGGKSHGDGKQRPHVGEPEWGFQRAGLPLSQPGVEFFCVLLLDCAHVVPTFNALKKKCCTSAVPRSALTVLLVWRADWTVRLCPGCRLLSGVSVARRLLGRYVLPEIRSALNTIGVKLPGRRWRRFRRFLDPRSRWPGTDRPAWTTVGFPARSLAGARRNDSLAALSPLCRAQLPGYQGLAG